MKKARHVLLRLLKISGIAVVSVLILLFLAPYLFPDTVGLQIKKLANQYITGELNFTSARLSFFTHFPSLTLNLHDVELKGSAPFQQDTLLSANKLGFGINLKKLIFDHEVSINKIYLSGAFIHVMVNELGQANYNIYSSDSTVKTSENKDSAASLHLEKIIINDSRLLYNDKSVPLLIQAEHLYYEGTGDLSKSIFDLSSHIRTDSLNFTINNQSYVRRKALDATLVTRINTKTLALVFQNNQVRMNKLNFAFTGKLDFLKNGYDIDVKLSTTDADLYQLITIFPPQYLDWLRKTTIRGTISMASTLKGKYIVSAGEMPDFTLKLAVHDGYIAYQDAHFPITGLNAMTEVELPSLNPEKLHIQIDSLSFHMDNDYLHAEMESRGLSEPQIHAVANAQLDLQNLNRALGISDFDMQGRLLLNLKASGKYAKKIVKTSLRKKDTIIASIPSFDFQCVFENGLVRYSWLTQPVQDIFLIMHANCPDADFHHAYFKVDTLHAKALNNFLDGQGVIHASTDFPINVRLKVSLELSDIEKIYPLDSLSLAGSLHAEVNSSGKYAPDHHLFPRTKAAVSVSSGSIKTKYYPHPLEKLNIELQAVNEGISLNGLNLSVHQAGLQFEGKSFQLKGEFRNFDDLIYDLSLQGDLDLERIYQVFARPNMGVNGILSANLHFKGKQSDAKNGRYDLLKNSGTLDLSHFTLTQELFPKPFIIHRGHFRFDQDKMWFEQFQSGYGQSDLQLDGFAENVINFILGKNEVLKANFNLRSKNIDLNEFSVYAPPKQSAKDTGAVSGVIMIPPNIDLTIKVDADRILYHDMVINHFQGGLNMQNGELDLTETDFNLIGCQVSMHAKYTTLSPLRADFAYQLKATDFDVHRAYQEIKLFHDLVSAAEHASGIVSLDYSLNGKLNEKMYPIYPSLNGAGVITVKKVKFNGWKLFNTLSSESGKTELKDPDLSKIDIKSSIKNNLIAIEKMKFKTGGFRIRFEGQTSFDNKVNFKMRIGLPPLGIIGIPLRITGNADNPKIKITKTDSDPLEEKEE